ncbi:MAG: hypothetical protein D6706_01675, partial [Chloroflexi bacterium]
MAGIILAILLVAGFAFVAPHVQAQALGEGELFGSAEDGSAFAEQAGLASMDLTSLIANIIRAVLGFAGVVLVVMILYGGFLWMTAGGNDDRVKKAKRTITNAVIGLVIAISSYAIASFV